MNVRRWAIACGALVAMFLMVAFGPAPQSGVPASATTVRPSIFLSYPDIISQTASGETWFTVDFDRLPGQPGTTRTMRVNWYSPLGTDGYWAIVLDPSSVEPLACLHATGGVNSESFSYIKPAGVHVLRLTLQGAYCSATSISAGVSAVTIELN